VSGIRKHLPLYLVTDRGFLKGRELIACVLEAVFGGVTMVQLREKDCPANEFAALAARLKEVLAPHAVPLIINDRIDIALAVRADGAHIGQSDIPAALARRILKRAHPFGKRPILGISVENAALARQAEKDGADYLGAGVTFSTNTKTDYQSTIGINGVKEICAAVQIPVIAIGGINKTNLGELAKVPGLAGASLVSAILAADDVRGAARELKNLWEGASCRP
jgi:thiamine-phosphate pyrophosphorylase